MKNEFVILYLAMCVSGCSDRSDRQLTVKQYSKPAPPIADSRISDLERQLEAAKSALERSEMEIKVLQAQRSEFAKLTDRLKDKATKQDVQITELLSLLETYEIQISVMEIRNPGLASQLRMLHNRVREARGYLDATFPGRYRPAIPPGGRQP
jgi:chromosome segregation ATPase